MKFNIFELGIFCFNSYVYYLTRASTRAFNLPNRDFSVLTRAFNLATHDFSLLTCGFELLTRGIELVTCRFELVTRGLELVTRVLLLHQLVYAILVQLNSCYLNPLGVWNLFKLVDFSNYKTFISFISAV